MPFKAKLKEKIDYWIGYAHEFYDISIERIECEVCWHCGKVRKKLPENFKG